MHLNTCFTYMNSSTTTIVKFIHNYLVQELLLSICGNMGPVLCNSCNCTLHSLTTKHKHNYRQINNCQFSYMHCYMHCHVQSRALSRALSHVLSQAVMKVVERLKQTLRPLHSTQSPLHLIYISKVFI